ncbi:ATP-binding domain-containing protein [Ralstonia pickettii]|uniref:ATP-binding domain-containing protein n=1 Tax=Ralstonia pickettii TaxID=329 RepID=UPI002115F8A8|nr:ATP-binding domain-containing protein [Ralstonia pickettii]
MAKLQEELLASPLRPGQSVLALTFMHGARQRLDQRLRSVPGLKGRYNCITVDGFARSIRERWRMLAGHLGQPNIDEVDFDQQCTLAADLLEREVVGGWIGAGYPLVVLDEAQDLDEGRVRIISALSNHARVQVAFDDFQCLDQQRRPSPIVTWIPTVSEPEILAKPQRTNIQELLDAATAIRNGRPPTAGRSFDVIGFKAAAMAAAYVASKLTYAQPRRSIAIITPSRAKGYAEQIVATISTKQCGKKRFGPFPTNWEEGDSAALHGLEGASFESDSLDAIRRIIAEMPHSVLRASLLRWLQRQETVAGRSSVSGAEVLARAKRITASHRARAHRPDSGRRALTVHQAKNREFDGVIVIWPYTVGSDDEGKRRLLYNAVTRAKSWCFVVVQGEESVKKIPFA